MSLYRVIQISCLKRLLQSYLYRTIELKYFRPKAPKRVTISIIRITIITTPTVSPFLMPVASGRVQISAKGTTMNVALKIRYIEVILSHKGALRTPCMIRSGNAFRNFGLDLNQNGTPTVTITMKTIPMLTASWILESSSRVQRTASGITEATPINKTKAIMKPNTAQSFFAIEQIPFAALLQVFAILAPSQLAID